MEPHIHNYDCATGKCKVCGLSIAAVELQEFEAKEAIRLAEEKQARADAEQARIDEDKRKRAEDDKTKINVVPIEVQGDVALKVLGMYFNRIEIREEDEPSEFLTIEKDILDRSSGYILARFAFEIPARSKIVYEVFVDGVKVDDYGTNLPYLEKSGIFDTILFKYPNTAKANRDGTHVIFVRAGLIVGIVEKELGMVVWGKVKGYTEAEFKIKLNPHQIE